jgi:hypothetical protein
LRRSIFQRRNSASFSSTRNEVYSVTIEKASPSRTISSTTAFREPVRSASASRRCARCQAHMRSISGLSPSRRGSSTSTVRVSVRPATSAETVAVTAPVPR